MSLLTGSAGRKSTLFRQQLLLLVLGASACGMADSGAENQIEGTLAVTLQGDATPPVGSTISLHASVSDASYAVSRFSWAVADSLGEAVQLEAQGYLSEDIAFRALTAGSYRISCVATFQGTAGWLETSMTLQVEDGPRLTYTVRVIPPAEQGLPAQDQQVLLGSADLQQDLELLAGQEVTLQLTDQEGEQLPAYLRLLLQSSDTLPWDRWLPTGSGTLSLLGGFHALIFPVDNEIAPHLLENQLPTQLPSSWTVALDPGSLLDGVVQREDGESLAGAVVTLHALEPLSQLLVPSTLATSDAQGQFQLRYRLREQTSLTVVPPASAALPVAVAQELALGLEEGSWQLYYAAAETVTVSGRVLVSDGVSPGAGARVLLELVTADEPVGRLVRDGREQPLWPRYRRELVADAQGRLADPATGQLSWQLPPGRYRAEGWPAAGAPAEQGYFAEKELQLGAGSAVALDFTLGRRAQLEGQVLDETGAAIRARVVARAPSGAFSAISERSGAFSLLVDPDQDYVLSVQPLESPGQPLSSQLMDGVRVEAGGQVMDIVLQPAVRLRGRVVTVGGLSIAGATLRLWCSSAECASHQVLDETQSASDGSYQLRIPRQDR